MMNPVVGNSALEEAARLGQDASISADRDRVRCHLRYALSRLRAETTETSHPAPRRAALLWELSSYAEAGLFPVHDRDETTADDDGGNDGGKGGGLPSRAPRFVDSRGTPCAVAHLLQRSEAENEDDDGEGDRLAAAIASNDTLNRAWVGEIASDPEVGPTLGAWCDRNGLSPADLALIQPSYHCVVVDVEEKCRVVSALSLHGVAAAAVLHLWMAVKVRRGSWTLWGARAVWAVAAYLSVATLLGHQWDTGERWRVASLPWSALWCVVVLASFFVSAMGAEAVGRRASWRSPLLCIGSIPVIYIIYCGLVSACRKSIEYDGSYEKAGWNWIGCRDKKGCYSLFP